MARRFADVEEEWLPDSVDGVCCKSPGNRCRPLILLNGNRNYERRRFTLAHELGHVLLPWHVGTIVDDFSTDAGMGIASSLMALEGEANRFAADLLMPPAWLGEEMRDDGSPDDVARQVADKAEVSLQAAWIQVSKVSCRTPSLMSI